MFPPGEGATTCTISLETQMTTLVLRRAYMVVGLFLKVKRNILYIFWRLYIG